MPVPVCVQVVLVYAVAGDALALDASKPMLQSGETQRLLHADQTAIVLSVAPERLSLGVQPSSALSSGSWLPSIVISPSSLSGQQSPDSALASRAQGSALADLNML